MHSTRTRVVIAVLAALSGRAQARVPADTSRVKALEFHGHVMMNMGYNAGASDPDRFDVMRPSKFPGSEDQYGSEGNMFVGVRQTRFGVNSFTPTPLGELFTQFEMFGTGVDSGQTTFRLRHACGQLGKWGAGQYRSPFMDIDVFPNGLEYRGPNSMVFFRNVQLRCMPIMGETDLTFALQRPGASSDQGIYNDFIGSQQVAGRLPLPDLSAEYRTATGSGPVELAGIVRNIEWEDLDTNSIDLSGSAVGRGLNLSTNTNVGKKTTIRGQFVFGQGIKQTDTVYVFTKAQRCSIRALVQGTKTFGEFTPGKGFEPRPRRRNT
jgi:hypothetical protein